MFRIFYINPTGLFSYGYAPNIVFDDGKVVNLVGVNDDTGGSSNGAGKTSVFNAVCEVLFGDNPTDVNGPSTVNKVWGKGCCARAEFESWEGVKYRVTLCRDWKESTHYQADNDNQTAYNGTGLYLERFDTVWRDCRGSGMPESRKKILEAIGLSYSRFLSIAYMSHRVGSRFLRGTNKDRVDILSGITGIEDWDAVMVKCRERKKDLEAKVHDVESKVAYETGILTERKTQLDTLAKTDWVWTIKGYAQSIEACRSKLALVDNNVQGLAMAEQELHNQMAEAMSLSQGLMEQLNALEKQRGSYAPVVRPPADPVLIQQVKDCEKSLNYARGAYAAYTGADGKLMSLANCPTCGTLITKAKKIKIEERARNLHDTVQQCEAALEKVKVSVAENELNICMEFNRLVQERNSLLDRFNMDLAEKNKAYKDSTSALAKPQQDLLMLGRQREAYQREQAGIQTELANLNSWLTVAKNNAQLLAALTAQVSAKQAEIDALRVQVSVVEQDSAVIMWFVTNIPFIKLHKLSTSMSILSDVINSYLSDMGDTLRVDITAFSEKKSKSVGDFTDVLKSEIQVEVKDGAKNIDPRLYSDGEIGKISNAFVRGLRELALQSGKGCNILMLDEMFSFIDYGNSQRLAESFVQRNAGTIIVTDNSGKAGDLMEFDTTWVARKRDGLSILEVQNG